MEKNDIREIRVPVNGGELVTYGYGKKADRPRMESKGSFMPYLILSV